MSPHLRVTTYAGNNAGRVPIFGSVRGILQSLYFQQVRMVSTNWTHACSRLSGGPVPPGWCFSASGAIPVFTLSFVILCVLGGSRFSGYTPNRPTLQTASYQFTPAPWTLPAIRCKIATMISSRSVYHESKSVQNGGDAMKTTTTIATTTIGSKVARRYRALASSAMLLGSILTILLLPAYGQQEVDPTWYDPWAAPHAAVAYPSQPPAVVHASQSPVATHRYQQMVTSVPSAPDAAKFRAQDTQLNQSRPSATRKSVGTPSAETRLRGAAWPTSFGLRWAESCDAASVPSGGLKSRKTSA
jgi:hypothetical protein